MEWPKALLISALLAILVVCFWLQSRIQRKMLKDHSWFSPGSLLVALKMPELYICAILVVVGYRLFQTMKSIGM